MINKLINSFFKIATDLKIDSVIIGGLALPAYKIARSTLDIDISINVKSQKKLNRLVDKLENRGIKTQQNPKVSHDLFIIFGKGSEAEVWLKPCDTFAWDQEMIEKTIKFRKNISVLSIEDFILTKLARSDRSSTDINDIIQILIANVNSIDWNYLYYRLNWANIKNDFEKLLGDLLVKVNHQFKDVVNSILRQYQKSKNKVKE